MRCLGVTLVSVALLGCRGTDEAPELRSEPAAEQSAAPNSPKTARPAVTEFELDSVEGSARANWLDDLGKLTDRVANCWSNARPMGDGALRVVITPAGAVESVTLTGTVPESLRACALDRARSFKFAPGADTMVAALTVHF